MPNTSKSFYKSKMFWVNLLALGVSAAVDYENGILMAQVLAVLNLILRAVTNEGIHFLKD
tara:strand:+ start:279 stop:458 length:180 start_codon:yes stop_codon:yes gene_type:complete